MTAFDVLGLGVSTLDILALVDHFPTGEEIQRADDLTIQGGGPVATAIVALARLGARTAILDAVGGDWRGELIRDEFAREGVATRHLIPHPSCSSAAACILVERATGARTIVYLPGTTPELSAADVPAGLIESARFLHLNGRHWDACLEAVRRAKGSGARVSFDGGADRFRPEMRRLLPMVDLAIVAHDFAEKYTGETDTAKAAAALLGEGPGLVVITDGTRGSWIFPESEAAFHQPAFRASPTVDTTGCGDAYHGAFLYGLLHELTLHQAAAFASAAAALNARRLGGRSGLPRLADVEEFLASGPEVIPAEI
jgi:sugar/nucleoside kinase (ribokinase family)